MSTADNPVRRDYESYTYFGIVRPPLCFASLVVRRPRIFSFLLSILAFFSLPGWTADAASSSWWLNMESGTNGALLTTNLLNSATLGGTTVPGKGWSVVPGPTASTMVSMKVYAGNEQPLSGPLTINGTAYTDAGSTRSYASRNDRRSHYAIYTFPTPQNRVSAGCFLRLENLIGAGGYYDLIQLNGYGYYVVLGFRDGPWDPDHPYDPTNKDDLDRRRAIRVHTAAPPYVGTDIPIFANKTYWVTLLWDTNPWDPNPVANKKGTAILRVYDPQTWQLVATPSVLELSDNPITAPLKCEDIRFGRCDNHDDTSPTSYHYFDDLIVDESGGKWPLMPGEISFTAHASNAAIPATLSVSATDPEGDPQTVTFYGRASGLFPAPPFTAIQTNTAVPSGTATAATWSGLSFNTDYEWYATATDGMGTVTSPIWTFRTTNNSPPTVTISAPPNNTLFATAPADILIEAAAADSNGVVAKVEFYAGTTLLGEDTTDPFTFLWSAVPEGVYSLTAIAQDDQGARTTSGAVIVTVGGPPLPPGALDAVAQSTSQIMLTWTDNSGNELGFEIDQSLDGVNFSLLGTVAPNTSSTVVSGLQPGTTYYYLVRAFNGAGPSDNSNIANATTPVPPPAAPTLLTATTISVSQVNLSWTDNASDETGFEVYQSIDGSNFVSVVSVGPDVTSAQASGLQPATTYFFLVRAFNSGGYSDSSPVTNATTLPLPPAAPINLAATAISSSRINLVWTDAANNETGFRIERSTDGVDFSPIATTATNATAYSDTNLAVSTTYYYRVRAYNAGGESDYSNVAGATTLVALPAAPTSLAAVAISSSQINLTWVDNADNETGFEVYQSQGGGAFALVGTAGPNVTNIQVTGLLPLTTYSFRVRAVNSAGYSPDSNLATATTLVSPPTAPVALGAVASSTSRINLAWTDTANNEAGFRIERSTDGLNFAQVATVSSNVTAWSNTGLAASTTYYYRVRAYNNGGTSAYSVVASATTFTNLPAAPSSLVATVVSSSQINLTWRDNSTTEIGFEVYQSQDGTNFASIGTVAANVTAAQITGLRPTTTYWFRVRAFNAGGYSGNSGTATSTTFPLPPSAPASLAATATGTNRIDLVWTDTANNETGFRIERSTDGVNFAQIASVSSNVIAWSNTGLAWSTTYYYRVRAYNTGGTSDYSSVASATTLAAPVTVTFTSIATQDGYVLESGENSSQGGSAFGTDTGTAGLRAGDDNTNRQFKAVVSFNTSAIPDGATILSATLRLRRGTIVGTNPFQTHGTCSVDIKSGNGFGGSTALTPDDFQAPADAAAVASLSNPSGNGQWSEGIINSTGLVFVDKTATTQFRISFTLDDNDNFGADYIGWYSGDNSNSNNRPQLVVVYR